MRSRIPLLASLSVLLLFCLASLPCSAENAGSSFASKAPSRTTSPDASPQTSTIAIPGPLRSFLRMAGISQQIAPEQVVPLLARNVFSLGYQDKTRPTEFLTLLVRYVTQARELSILGGPNAVIRVSSCQEAKPLLDVLGYRERPDCGQKGSYLEASNPERAFLTIDSGFPLPALEKALQFGTVFEYPYPTARVPIVFEEHDWLTKGHGSNLLDALLRNPDLSRLYWAFSRMDAQTQVALRQSPGLARITPYAPVADFYGQYLRIRSGRVLVPGGANAEPHWRDLVGANPSSPGEFVQRLFAKDNGWLAAYFDALSRVDPAQQEHFTQAPRLHNLYEALKKSGDSPSATHSVFRPDPSLLLLFTRVQWEANGQPYVPGNVTVWQRILSQNNGDSPAAKEVRRRARHISTPEQLLEAMFSLSRIETDTGPVQTYLFLSELDGRRPPEHRLSPQTISLLAAKFPELCDQYRLFAEFPTLNDAAITSFLQTTQGLDAISNHDLRGNALGIFESLVSLWQIFARQGEIQRADLNTSLEQIEHPFGHIVSATQLYDVGNRGIKDLLAAAHAPANDPQEALLDLLAGPHQTGVDGERMHQELVRRMQLVLANQRLVSLDTLVDLGNGLHTLSAEQAERDRLLQLAGELREFQMPRPIFSNSERTEWAEGIYNNRHTDTEMRTDLTKVVKSPASAVQLAEARGEMAPFLRDTLTGLNYAYYEPPGAETLHYNPLFVRSHDFGGETVQGVRIWQDPQLFGAGSPAGGGARLVGSLADLPYVLASAEQDFIAPQNVQALIWEEVVPGLLTGAVVPRWWNVSKDELHAVALYQEMGEQLIDASSKNDELRNQVMSILSERMAPRTADRIEVALRSGEPETALAITAPADTFYLAAQFRKRYPEASDPVPAEKDLQELAQRAPDQVSWDRLSRDFGVPHPVLTYSYSRELLNLSPFPSFMGNANRLFVESWDSTNLYWARLADERGLSPVMLNRLVPELTRRMVEKIFGTDPMEDWPALVRATKQTGEEFLQGKIATVAINDGNSDRQHGGEMAGPTK